MKESIFRKKSLDRISSPEQLNDYIRASNPGVWLVLGAIVALLISVCVWGIFGKLDTKLTTAAVCENGKLFCFVREDDIEKVKSGMKVLVNEDECAVTGISEKPVSTDENFDDYILHLGSSQKGEWVYEVQTSGTPRRGNLFRRYCCGKYFTFSAAV